MRIWAEFSASQCIHLLLSVCILDQSLLSNFLKSIRSNHALLLFVSQSFTVSRCIPLLCTNNQSVVFCCAVDTFVSPLSLDLKKLKNLSQNGSLVRRFKNPQIDLLVVCWFFLLKAQARRLFLFFIWVLFSDSLFQVYLFSLNLFQPILCAFCSLLQIFAIISSFFQARWDYLYTYFCIIQTHPNWHEALIIW